MFISPQIPVVPSLPTQVFPFQVSPWMNNAATTNPFWFNSYQPAIPSFQPRFIVPVANQIGAPRILPQLGGFPTAITPQVMSPFTSLQGAYNPYIEPTTLAAYGIPSVAQPFALSPEAATLFAQQCLAQQYGAQQCAPANYGINPFQPQYTAQPFPFLTYAAYGQQPATLSPGVVAPTVQQPVLH